MYKNELLFYTLYNKNDTTYNFMNRKLGTDCLKLIFDESYLIFIN